MNEDPLKIPTDADWRSEPWCLDVESAYRYFFGKSMAEAIELFEANALTHQEDVMFMPGPAFRYYVRAYCSYLLSEAARGDSDGASCFIRVIAHRAQYTRDDVAAAWESIAPVLVKLATEQEFYDADWHIYGDFRTRIDEIVKLGFQLPVDTTSPEVVPLDITLADLNWGDRILSPHAAAQVLHQSGIHGITPDSSKAEVIRILGEPQSSGGARHSEFGEIPDWICYRRPDCRLRFEFEQKRLANMAVMPLEDPVDEIAKEVDRKFTNLLRFEELFGPEDEPGSPQ